MTHAHSFYSKHFDKDLFPQESFKFCFSKS